MKSYRPFSIPFHSSLIVRSLLCTLGLLIIILGASGYLSIQYIKKEAIADLDTDSRYITHITAEALSLPLWNLDTSQVQEQLHALRESEHVCGARVVDANGKIFANENFPPVIASDQVTYSNNIHYKGVDGEIETIGTLDICISNSFLSEMLHGVIIQQFLFFMLITIGVLAATYISLLIIMKPLLGIRQAMQRLVHTMQPISDPKLLKQNEIGALVHSFNVMTSDLAQTYQQLNIAKEEAQAADNAKSDFLSNMTHELRTPLNSIIGMTNLLLERIHEPDEQEMLSVMHQSSMILYDVVNDILDLSKIEARAIILENIGFDVESVLRRVVETIRPLARKKNLYLSFEFEYRIPFLLGDPLRISQIVSNLLSNAIKYTDTGGVSIHVYSNHISKDQIELHCKVTDTGIGIPKEKLDLIFKKFTQMDASNTRRFGGTGLGLTITRELVEMMGGTIAVESNNNNGATFWFKIPFTTSGNLEEEHRASKRRKLTRLNGNIPPSKASILVVEDHPLNQALIKRLLAKYGLTNFALVEDGRQALKSLEEHEYDLVLMDCFMPELNGYEATIHIRELEKKTRKHLPIIAMTANAMLGDEEKCLSVGMDDYIAKPILESEFLNVLSQWIKFPEALFKHNNEHASAPSKKDPLPINLSILRTYSNGDRKIEKELLKIFITQAEKNMQNLADIAEEGGEKWVLTAHSMKGAAGGIGARKLKELCENAQAMGESTADIRIQTLSKMQEEYNAVKNCIQGMGFLEE